ncbi:hypothetical protein EFE42_04315 [Methanohalophilus sp. RSK]|uniref:DUF6951 family protein n=1 Tax=Methanohalophilus sp. RSK TaxID=2485783 RepID=UPI000F4391C8|nr:hypothetical protein [Methanohalophilus sp. RSK]RNI14605.1 hypothetical protein EFE42_04315 [Methanohalophilus sp. RSK]
MTEVTVKSNVCGFTHKVCGKMDGDKIIIDIDTPCKTIKGMSHMEVPMMDVSDIKDNYVMQKAQEAQCSVTCLVPCAVLHVCWMEAGMMSKSLAKEAGDVRIEFE